MQIIRTLKKIPNCVATIGAYDGIHLGHQKILKLACKKARQLKLPAVVVIFEPQPLEFLLQQQASARLTTLAEKLVIFKQLGVDIVMCLKFDSELANITADAFVTQVLLEKLQVKYLVIGDDFSFGHNCSGGFVLLKKYDQFTTEQIPSLQLNGIRISSTVIRQALAAGDLETAQKFLGHPYTMSGHVAHGNRLGHLLGFPTANIFLRRKILPIRGVFICKVYLEQQQLFGIANIGTRPTVDGTKNILEVNILDFDRDIYGKKLTVEFITKIRDEKKFTSLDILKQHIKQDVTAAIKLLTEEKIC